VRGKGAGLRATLACCLVAACRQAEPVTPTAPGRSATSAAAIFPDTSIVDGIPTFTHGNGAVERAPQLTLDTAPLVTFDAGANADFDLTKIRHPLLLADGRLLAAISLGAGRLILFNANGTPARVIAPSGEGPGDVRSPAAPVALTPDTALVVDVALHRLNWVTGDGGIVRSIPLQATVLPFCFQSAALVAGNLLLATDNCLAPGTIDQPTRPPAAIVVMHLDFGAPDTVTRLPGFEMIPFETRYHGVKRIDALPLRLGEAAQAAPWDSGFVSATGERGYMLDRRALDGHVVARIRVNGPRRVVTAAMRDGRIADELERLNGPHSDGLADASESQREAREVPFADSLPPYGGLFPAPGNVMWVLDYPAPADSTWSATAFRPDGAILGRLTAHMKSAIPVAFTKDRVLVRQVDSDGTVTFALFRIVPVSK
jgi:hypothetical protein